MAEASREVILAAGRAGKLAGDCPSEHGEHMAKMVEQMIHDWLRQYANYVTLVIEEWLPEMASVG